MKIEPGTRVRGYGSHYGTQPDGAEGVYIRRMDLNNIEPHIFHVVNVDGQPENQDTVFHKVVPIKENSAN